MATFRLLPHGKKIAPKKPKVDRKKLDEEEEMKRKLREAYWSLMCGLAQLPVELILAALLVYVDVETSVTFFVLLTTMKLYRINKSTSQNIIFTFLEISVGYEIISNHFSSYEVQCERGSTLVSSFTQVLISSWSHSLLIPASMLPLHMIDIDINTFYVVVPICILFYAVFAMKVGHSVNTILFGFILLITPVLVSMEINDGDVSTTSLYISSFGYCIIIAHVLSVVYSCIGRHQVTAQVVFAMVALVLISTTATYNMQWKNRANTIKNAYKRGPTSSRLTYEMGKLMMFEGKYGKAFHLMEKSRKRSKHDVTTASLLEYYVKSHHNQTKVTNLYESAISHCPQSEWIYNKFIAFQLKSKNFKTAEDTFKTTLKRTKNKNIVPLLEMITSQVDDITATSVIKESMSVVCKGGQAVVDGGDDVELSSCGPQDAPWVDLYTSIKGERQLSGEIAKTMNTK